MHTTTQPLRTETRWWPRLGISMFHTSSTRQLRALFLLKAAIVWPRSHMSGVGRLARHSYKQQLRMNQVPY
jgi:hypothetical protein